jgi:amidase
MLASDRDRSSAVPELVRMSALELSRAIKTRRASCREVMAAFLDHIERVNPMVNAVVSLQERGALLDRASERDAQLSRGEDMGWMHGLPHAVKDLAATAGIRTTSGSALRDGIPDEDDLFVARIRRCGAIFIGKTNTPEFGLGSQTYNDIFGTTRNAYDPSRTAGGSSGGGG